MLSPQANSTFISLETSLLFLFFFTKKDEHTTCFSKRLPRLRPWDVQIRSKAFTATGATAGTGPSSRFSTTRFWESYAQQGTLGSWIGSKCSNELIINIKAKQKPHRWFTKNSIYVIKTNISLSKSRRHIFLLKPLILNDLRKCNSLFYVTKKEMQLVFTCLVRQKKDYQPKRKLVARINYFFGQRNKLTSAKLTWARTYCSRIGIKHSLDQFLCTWWEPRGTCEISLEYLWVMVSQEPFEAEAYKHKTEDKGTKARKNAERALSLAVKSTS